ncbi:hypothetical protein ACX40Y_16465 [Sphingomonas sp. RS6]
MIGTPKPTASLSSGLLARKGQARPAMRPQGFLGITHSGGPDDLGWNDMGLDSHGAAPVPAPAPLADAAVRPPVTPVERPAVLRQREVLDRRLAEPAAEAVPEPVEPAQAAPVEPPVPAAAAESEPEAAPVATRALSRNLVDRVARDVRAKKGKAAFTLRLDTDRHLRLRLASAVTNRSAQQLVTEALDALLASLKEVDTLARQVGTGRKE